MLKRVIVVLTATVAVAATSTIVEAPPVAATDLRFRAAPAKVVVNQAYENIAWSLAGSDSYWVESADVTLEHVATREVADFDFVYDGDTSGTLRFDNYSRYGRYVVHGTAYDHDYDEMSPAPTYVTIKRAARSPLTVSRSGAYVTLRTRTTKFWGGYPLWANHRGATVRFQRLTDGVWRTIATRTVPRDGVSRLRYRRPRAAAYRVVVAQAPAVWGLTTGRVRR